MSIDENPNRISKEMIIYSNKSHFQAVKVTIFRMPIVGAKAYTLDRLFFFITLRNVISTGIKSCV